MTAVQTPGRYGALVLDEEKITMFQEKPIGDGGWINGGFFVLEPKVFDYIDNDYTTWENDPMGGYDPYSASKGCSELVTSSYRNSFFNLDEYGRKHNTLIASARAGNVIGGGDWAKDRIITDLMEAVSEGKKLYIRNPNATRPWQHVLEPLSGYLLLGQKLLEGKKDFAGAWNFGPNDDGAIPVVQMVQKMQKIWNKIDYRIDQNKNNPHEAGFLKLDCSKARIKFNWKNIWSSNITFAKIAEWYRMFYENQQVITENQLKEYVADAGKAEIVWTK